MFNLSPAGRASLQTTSGKTVRESQQRRARYAPRPWNLARVIFIFCIFRILKFIFRFFFSLSFHQLREFAKSENLSLSLSLSLTLPSDQFNDVRAVADIHARRAHPLDLQPPQQRPEGISDRHVDPILPPGGAIRCGLLQLRRTWSRILSQMDLPQRPRPRLCRRLSTRPPPLVRRRFARRRQARVLAPLPPPKNRLPRF